MMRILFHLRRKREKKRKKKKQLEIESLPSGRIDIEKEDPFFPRRRGQRLVPF
jgi:hypothetical protein